MTQPGVDSHAPRHCEVFIKVCPPIHPGTSVPPWSVFEAAVQPVRSSDRMVGAASDEVDGERSMNQ